MAEMTDALLGEAIEAARLRRGWGQHDLSDRLVAHGLNWSRATVSKVETGTRTVKAVELPVLMDVLGLTLGDLFAHASDELRTRIYAQTGRVNRASARLEAVQSVARVVAEEESSARDGLFEEVSMLNLFNFVRAVRDAPESVTEVSWSRERVSEVLGRISFDGVTALVFAQELHSGLEHVEFGTDPGAEMFAYRAGGAG